MNPSIHQGYPGPPHDARASSNGSLPTPPLSAGSPFSQRYVDASHTNANVRPGITPVSIPSRVVPQDQRAPDRRDSAWLQGNMVAQVNATGQTHFQNWENPGRNGNVRGAVQQSQSQRQQQQNPVRRSSHHADLQQTLPRLQPFGVSHHQQHGRNSNDQVIGIPQPSRGIPPTMVQHSAACPCCRPPTHPAPQPGLRHVPSHPVVSIPAAQSSAREPSQDSPINPTDPSSHAAVILDPIRSMLMQTFETAHHSLTSEFSRLSQYIHTRESQVRKTFYAEVQREAASHIRGLEQERDKIRVELRATEERCGQMETEKARMEEQYTKMRVCCAKLMLVCKAMEIECAKLREDGYGLRDEIVRLSQMNMQLGDKACVDTSRRSEEKDIKPSHDFVSPDRAQSSSGDQFPDSGPYPSTIKEEQSPPQDAEPSPIAERDAEVATVLAEAQEERKRRQKAERELALMKEMFSQLVSERCVDSVSPFSPINGMSSFINSAWLPNALAATGGLNTTSDASQMSVDEVRRDSIDRAAVKQNEMPGNIVLPPDQADNLVSTKPADSPDEFMQWISPPPGLIDLTMDSPMQLTSALPPLSRRVEDFDRKRESTSPAEATQPPPKRRRMVSDSISDQDGAGDTDKNSRSDMLVEMPIALSIPITPSTEGQSHAIDGEDVDKTLVEGISPSLHADEGLPTGLCAPDPGGDAVSGGTDIVNDADAGKSNATDYPDPPVTEEMQVEEPVHEEPVHEEPVHEVDSPRPPSAKLSIRHINLVYEVSEDKMVCRLCLNRVRKLHLDLPVASFPRNAPWDEISGHCEEKHPASFEKLVVMTPEQIALADKHARQPNRK